MGKREREKGKKRGGAVRASGDCGRGRPRGCGPREMGHAAGKEGEREKGGAGFAAAGHDASHWMGRALKSGVGQEKILGLGFRV